MPRRANPRENGLSRRRLSRVVAQDGDAEAAARRLRDAGASVVALAADCAEKARSAEQRAVTGNGGSGEGGGGGTEVDCELELVASVDRWLEQLQSQGPVL